MDECHRLNIKNSADKTSKNQYQGVLDHLSKFNPKLKLLGLTATPFRLGLGWIYQYHYYGIQRSDQPTPFVKCIYELPLAQLIKQGYLTPPKQINAAVSEYDFSELTTNNQGDYQPTDINRIVAQHPRVTTGICEHIQALATERKGVMIFAATVEHANEIYQYFDPSQAALVTGKTPNDQRAQIIADFKAQKLKYLINVSVLTTGFDAPHVDFIAMLRPTQSLGLYQQIVGRGLRLAPNKTDCLVIDYAGNGYDIFYPEVGSKKPDSDNQPVMVKCPQCDFANTFWGKLAENGELVEHYGRRCWGYEEFENDDGKLERVSCTYRFKFKQCPTCLVENDIAARRCHSCGTAIIDPDDQLRKALNLSDAMVIRCAGIVLQAITQTKFKITYHDEDGLELTESIDFQYKKAQQAFNASFGKRMKAGSEPVTFSLAEQVVAQQTYLPIPDFVIAYKDKKMKNKAEARWLVKEKLFDYEGNYRKADKSGY